MKGNDDRCLQLIGQQRTKSQPPHSFHQDPAILAITTAPTGNTALLIKLVQRLVEAQDGVGRGGEPPLSVAFHRDPLIVEVQAE